jgi:hypothetical protein
MHHSFVYSLYTYVYILVEYMSRLSTDILESGSLNLPQHFGPHSHIIGTIYLYICISSIVLSSNVERSSKTCLSPDFSKRTSVICSALSMPLEIKLMYLTYATHRTWRPILDSKYNNLIYERLLACPGLRCAQ